MSRWRLLVAVSALAACACFEPPPRPLPLVDVVEVEEAEEVPAPAPCLVGEAPCAPIAEVALGREHGCARMEDGRLFCWGARGHGQVGDRVVATTAVAPVRVALPGPIRSVALGWDHSCVLGLAGEVYCWGRNSEGQIGQTSQDVVAEPTRIAIDTAAAIAAGGRTTCALMVDGAVMCWGARLDGLASEPDGKLNVSVTGPERIVGLPGTAGVSALRLGGSFACAWANNLAPRLGASAAGADVVRCWGDNAFGQLGLGDRVDRAEPAVVAGLPERLDALALGARHACALHDGALSCWGDNSDGQLAQSVANPFVEAPVASVEPAPGASLLALGARNGCVGVAAGVACWGSAREGVLGSVGEARVKPERVAGTREVAVLAMGMAQACGAADGGLECWGDGRDGAFGETRTITPPVALVVTGDDEGCGLVPPGGPHPTAPCQVCGRDGEYAPCAFGCHAGRCRDVPLADASGVRFASDDGEFCVARGDGRVLCWRGEEDDVLVNEVDDVKAVALGGGTRCAIDGLGRVRCWDGAARVVIEGASSLAAGADGACAIVGGVAWCWRGDEAPRALEAPEAVRAVAVGRGRRCALGEAGDAIWCWRDEDGAAEAIDVAGDVAGLAGVAGHFLVIGADGLIGGWGENAAYQVGPDLPAVLANVVFPTDLRGVLTQPLRAVVGGETRSCAMSLAGTVMCWGAAREAPVKMPLAGLGHVAIGAQMTCAIQDGVQLWCWREGEAARHFPRIGAD